MPDLVRLRDIVDTFSEQDLDLIVPIDFKDADSESLPYINTYNGFLASKKYEEAYQYRLEHSDILEPLIIDAKKLNIQQAMMINTYLFAKGEKSALNTMYDNNISKLIADNVQDAIDELYKTKLDLAGGTLTGDLFATTIRANKIYGAVWNDYAEWFEKENVKDKFEVGDICSWYKNGVILSPPNDINVVGVVSNTYGHILGGNPLADMEENHKNFVPIGLVGRVKVKVIGEVNRGDLIVSAGSGIGQVNNEASIGHVIGKALESSNDKNVKLITVLIK